MILIDKQGHLVTENCWACLHDFAKSIGLKRSWFQDKRLPHYDCTTESMIQKAIDKGATLVSSKEIVKAVKLCLDECGRPRPYEGKIRKDDKCKESTETE